MITHKQASIKVCSSHKREDRLSILKELQAEGFENYQAEFDKSKDVLKKENKNG